MKKWGTIAAIVASAIFAVLDLVHDFAANDPIGYFSHEPSRLLYVAGIAITGGLVMLGFYKLPSRAQRHVRIFGLGAAASTATGVFGYFVFGSFSLASMISRFGGSIWPLLSMLLPALLMLCALAASCWFACWRAWKRRVS